MEEDTKSSLEKPYIRLILVLPLLPLAFLSKVWFTLYTIFCFIFLFWNYEWSSLGVKISDIREGLRRTWPYFVLTLVVLPLPVWFLIDQYLPDFYTHVFGRVGLIDLFQFLVAGIIMIPFMEEVIFRGVVQEQLGQYTNDASALMLSSAMFAMVHWSPGMPLLVGADLFLVFVDSLWFGLIYLKSRNVLLSTLCHSLGNLIVFLYGALILGLVL
ncbi:MAG: CPBP family intramembrane glutamic endopeptidase [Candidatus Thorarchaeota archaeon]